MYSYSDPNSYVTYLHFERCVFTISIYLSLAREAFRGVSRWLRGRRERPFVARVAKGGGLPRLVCEQPIVANVIQFTAACLCPPAPRPP